MDLKNMRKHSEEYERGSYIHFSQILSLSAMLSWMVCMIAALSLPSVAGKFSIRGKDVFRTHPSIINTIDEAS